MVRGGWGRAGGGGGGRGGAGAIMACAGGGGSRAWTVGKLCVKACAWGEWGVGECEEWGVGSGVF